jgi:hypothetical protein
VIREIAVKEDDIMDDSPPRPRRSPTVVLLDALLSLATATVVPATVRPGRRPRLAGRLWLAAGVLIVAGGTAIVVGTLLRTPGGLTDLPPAGLGGPAATSSIAPPATAEPSPSPSATVPATRVAATATTGAPPVPGSTAPSSAPSAGSRLTAAYAAQTGTGLLGYRAGVTLTAGGPAPAADWRLTITLPRPTLQIAAVDGATVVQDGSVWTFTPTGATRQVAPGTPVTISFDVRGATLVDGEPTDCRINGDPCA